MKVYVIYDPLYEKVICVHSKEDMECDDCKPIREERETTNFAYYLEECERVVRTGVRNENLDKLLDG